MLANYVAATNDTAILDRALPLAEARSHFLSLFPTSLTLCLSGSWHGGANIALSPSPALIQTLLTHSHATPSPIALLGPNLT